MASYNVVLKAVADVVFDAKKQVLKDFAAFLAEKIDFDDDMKGYFDEFEKTIVKETPSKKKSSGESSDTEKKKRAPSAYNMFISEKMAEIKKVKPELKGKELMKAAIEIWNESKSKSDPEEESAPEPEPEPPKTKGKGKK